MWCAVITEAEGLGASGIGSDGRWEADGATADVELSVKGIAAV